MKKALAILFLAFTTSQSWAATLPWQTLGNANTYWSQTLGLKPASPRALTLHEITTSANLLPDASFRVLNAALDFQIKQLSSQELIRFADTMRHVIVYVSGASPQKADLYNRAGWWNLSYPVAKRYGLTINKLIDERFDFEKSTMAAMRYAQDLQTRFPEEQSWVSAFVASPLAVSRPSYRYESDTIKRQLFAVQRLMYLNEFTQVEAYAIQNFYNGIEVYKPKNKMLTSLIIERTGIPANVLYALNPWLVTDEVPAKATIKITKLAYDRIKKEEADIAMLSEARLEDKAASTSAKLAAEEKTANEVKTTYKVKSGDNLGLIAERNQVSVSSIKRWNNLRSDVIYSGQKLIIYQKAGPAASTSPAIAKVDVKDFIEYRVKDGDTLWSIAKQFPGVSPDNIMSWNSIDANIQAGQKIKILKSEITPP